MRLSHVHFVSIKAIEIFSSNSSTSISEVLKLVSNLANLTTPENGSSLYALDLSTSNYIISKTLDALQNSVLTLPQANTTVSGNMLT